MYHRRQHKSIATPGKLRKGSGIAQTAPDLSESIRISAAVTVDLAISPVLDRKGRKSVGAEPAASGCAHNSLSPIEGSPYHSALCCEFP